MTKSNDDKVIEYSGGYSEAHEMAEKYMGYSPVNAVQAEREDKLLDAVLAAKPKLDWKNNLQWIRWEICSIHDCVDNNMYDCNMIGYDDEGNVYNGWATVYDPHSGDGQWDTVTDVEQES